ncbi:MAG: hypothetical protein JO069_08475, partial [Verrucomicrobia bacterium]|nr:hypothetical protein [Verrucomicrobiota bacterium]
MAAVNCKFRPLYARLFGLAILLAGASSGAQPALQAGPVVAIIQPAFYRVPDQRPVRNSARTVVAYYELTNGSELTPCPAADEPGA